ncbi:MAG: hypothetical protein ACKOHM_09330 [Spartobacteria bacterium]
MTQTSAAKRRFCLTHGYKARAAARFVPNGRRAGRPIRVFWSP